MRACWLKWVGWDWSISADYIWLIFSDANTVYLVALATWIKDAFWQIKGNCLRKEIENDFEFSKQSELDDASKYLIASKMLV